MKQQKKTKKLPSIPRKISVVGDLFPIEPLTQDKLAEYGITDAPVDTALGLCNQLKGVILLRPGMGLSRTQSTLLHEILHVIVGHSCLGLKAEKEEQVVTLISQMLYETFKTNKNLLEFLGAKGDD